MLTNKNADPYRYLRHFRLSSVLAFLALVLAGCQPAGPKALLLGEKYINQGDYEKALRYLTRASVLVPEQPQVWNHLGLAYHGLKQPVKAADAYQRAVRIDRTQSAPEQPEGDRSGGRVPRTLQGDGQGRANLQLDAIYGW
jgi:tetratricopeptide (TPR) repeat protein